MYYPPTIIHFLVWWLLVSGPEAKSADNLSPHVQNIISGGISIDPFAFRTRGQATNQERNSLACYWDTSDGTIVEALSAREFAPAENDTYAVAVIVRNAIGNETQALVTGSSEPATARVDTSQTYQVMDGFGGFGAQDYPWTHGPFTSEQFISDLVEDLGLTILRDEVPTNFEIENDNGDPQATELANFNINGNYPGHHRPLGARLQYLRNLKTADPSIKLIASVWSPPPWMKANLAVDNGTDQNTAPNYDSTPEQDDNQLLPEYYEEFAEMCVAYIRILKQECNIDLFALSIQNEPRFSQSYQSCLYNGEALRDLLKVVGHRLEDEGLSTLLLVPEDVGHYEGIHKILQPILNDPEARQYADILAVHGYAFDGITAGSQDAATWEAMYQWGAPYDIPLWMTETSGFENSLNGAIKLAQAMYTAIRYGNVSAWLFWTISGGEQLDAYNLMTATGKKSKRYYVSKQFYRYVRPGALRTESSVEKDGLLILSFRHPQQKTATVILINTTDSDQLIEMDMNGLPSYLNVYRTSEKEDCQEREALTTENNRLILIGMSVTTLYGSY